MWACALEVLILSTCGVGLDTGVEQACGHAGLHTPPPPHFLLNCSYIHRFWAQVRAYAPEVLILSPCGAGLDCGVEQACGLAGLPGWWALPAVRSGRVFVADHSMFSRPGPR